MTDDELARYLTAKVEMHDVALVHAIASLCAIAGPEKGEAFLRGFEDISSRTTFMPDHLDLATAEGQREIAQRQEMSRKVTQQFAQRVRAHLAASIRAQS